MSENHADKSRSDKGTIRLTERDMTVLSWVGEQFAVRLDHLPLLLTREADGYARKRHKGALVSKSAVYYQLNRWKSAELVQSTKILNEQPPWVWLTKKGIREMGLPYDERNPTASRVRHLHAVNAIRLQIEERLDIVWESERLINQERKAKKKKHIVDGLVRMYEEGEERVAAIEVELTQKSAVRYKSILHELAKDYNEVWYFCNDASVRAVEKAVETAQIPESKCIFQIYPIPASLSG